PTIGGRYSALSRFGIVPAALMGVELARLRERTQEMVEACRGASNPGLELGIAFGENWRQGRDKVCINPNPGGFGFWAEQLLAESTGKDGKGLVPAPEESLNVPDRQPGEVLIDDPRGLGARYLYSTGQLHMGGPNTGLFVQVVDDPGDELKIPGKPFGFRRLVRAQAAGDYASLQDRGRRIIRVRLEDL